MKEEYDFSDSSENPYAKRLKKQGQIRREREDLKRRYGAAYERLNAILFSEDPIGIGFIQNKDEYEPEAGTILPRLRSCRSVEDVRRVVHEEFVKWFYADIAGSPERYDVIAARVWKEVVPELRGID